MITAAEFGELLSVAQRHGATRLRVQADGAFEVDLTPSLPRPTMGATASSELVERTRIEDAMRDMGLTPAPFPEVG